MNLAGSVIIITGSATGLGSATAKLAASKGANVVIKYTKSETEANETAAACREVGARVVGQLHTLVVVDDSVIAQEVGGAGPDVQIDLEPSSFLQLQLVVEILGGLDRPPLLRT